MHFPGNGAFQGQDNRAGFQSQGTHPTLNSSCIAHTSALLTLGPLAQKAISMDDDKMLESIREEDIAVLTFYFNSAQTR